MEYFQMQQIIIFVICIIVIETYYKFVSNRNVKKLEKSILMIVGMLFLFMLTYPVQGMTELPDVSYSNKTNFETQVVDNQYSLNYTDSFFDVVIGTECFNDNVHRTFFFEDINNNNLVIERNYRQINIFLGYETLVLNTSVSINDKVIYEGSESDSIVLVTFLWYPVRYTELDFSKSDHILISKAKYTGIGDEKIDVSLNKSYYWNNLTMNFPTVYTFNNTDIWIDYQDNSQAKIVSNINTEYSKLNIVFKIIFQIFNGVMWIINHVTFGTVISDTDYILYQTYLLIPLTVLNYLLSIAFSILNFIMIMGFIWFFCITEMLIFIFAYIKSGQRLVNSFPLFIDYSKNYWNYILIKPSTWMYEHLLVGVVRIFRG